MSSVCTWQRVGAVAVMALLVVHGVRAQPNAKEVLLSFKMSLANPAALSGWNLTQALPTWEGVTSDKSGVVVAVDLHERWVYDESLSGPLPAQWSMLTGLTYLDLSSSQDLSGSLPAQWSVLTGLEWLDLSQNVGLSGPLPAQWSVLTRLTELSLAETSLSGTLPAQWSMLSGLVVLRLSSNPALSGPLPPEWSMLVGVTDLSVAYNPGLSGPLPAQWSVLTGVMWLVLSDNPGLSGTLPAQWSVLTGLEGLRLSSNPGLSGPLPPQWSALTGLGGLLLFANPGLSGLLPLQWSVLTHLQELHLFYNPGLSGPLPAQWSTLRSLSVLQLSHNPGLSGPLPAQWSTLRSLSVLQLSDNPGLSGSVPAQWSALTGLQALDLSGTYRVGPPPLRAWSQLISNLFSLGLHAEHLDNSMPPEVWEPLGLQDKLISLSVGSVDGPVPGWMTTLMSLSRLNMSSCSLNGPLPAVWSTLTSLQSLDLSNNALAGPLPAEWSAMAGLRGLALDHNVLDGPLPAEWSAIHGLDSLSLVNNSLDGALPAEWSELCYLRSLALADNSLDGTLPAQWSSMTMLTSLSLNNNNLTGTIPAAWSALPPDMDIKYVEQWHSCCSMAVLKLAGNKLHGPIPPAWSTNASWWNAFVYLDISGNQLTGPLPPIPTSIQYFNASDNLFSGPIPAIPLALVYMHVGRNNLSGPIPNITNSSLVFFDASGNRLSSLPPVFQAPRAAYLNLASNELQGTLPGAGYNHSLVYCDMSNNELSGGIPASWHGHTWQYLALDHNSLSGSVPVWLGNVTVLLLQHNRLNSSLPAQWPRANASRVVSFASNAITALPGNWTVIFRNLSLLDVSDTKVKSVPLSWMNPGAFKGDNQTVLRLGALWKLKDHEWRQAVCIQESLNSKLDASLRKTTLPLEIQLQVQDDINRALAGLTSDLRSLNVTGVTFDILGALQLRQGSVPRYRTYDVCGNKSAKTIVTVQWAALGAVLLLLLVLYVLESRYKVFSGIKVQGRSCLPLDTQRRGAHAVTLGGSLFHAAKHAVSLLFYWYDIITDILLITQVWHRQTWPRYVLLGVFVLHYSVSVLVLCWKLALRLRYRILMLVFGLPLMPLLDTLMFVYLALGGQVGKRIQACCIHVGALRLDQWQQLLEMRDVLEVLLEAMPTAILQSAVFLVGNTPEIGVYVENQLYILSAVGSCAQIIRLLAFILWDSLKHDQSPWVTLWLRLSMGGGSAQVRHAVHGGGTGGSSMGTSKTIASAGETMSDTMALARDTNGALAECHGKAAAPDPASGSTFINLASLCHLLPPGINPTKSSHSRTLADGTKEALGGMHEL